MKRSDFKDMLSRLKELHQMPINDLRQEFSDMRVTKYGDVSMSQVKKECQGWSRIDMIMDRIETEYYHLAESDYPER